MDHSEIKTQIEGLIRRSTLYKYLPFGRGTVLTGRSSIMFDDSQGYQKRLREQSKHASIEAVSFGHEMSECDLYRASLGKNMHELFMYNCRYSPKPTQFSIVST